LRRTEDDAKNQQRQVEQKEEAIKMLRNEKESLQGQNKKNT